MVDAPRYHYLNSALYRVFSGLLVAECFLALGKEPSLLSVFLYSAKTFFAEWKKILGKENFKSNFEALNKFKSKSF